MATVGSRQIVGTGTTADAWAGWPGFADMPMLDTNILLTRRVVIVAPHPDDEVLGCGGLIHHLASVGRPVVLMAVTDGGASHPGSALWPAGALLVTRPRETQDALARLGLSEPCVDRLGIGDGEVTAQEDALTHQLIERLEPDDLVIVTWELDGHPDHEAAGRAAKRACETRAIPCLQMPIWAWHWASPGDARVPWARARKFMLDDAALAAKRHALAAFQSQIEPDTSTGAAPILPPAVLERLIRPFEVYLI